MNSGAATSHLPLASYRRGRLTSAWKTFMCVELCTQRLRARRHVWIRLHVPRSLASETHCGLLYLLAPEMVRLVACVMVLWECLLFLAKTEQLRAGWLI